MDLLRKRKTAKSAFTLAEVLITMSIIGVIAAMVLPTLLTDINHRVMESKKKVETRKLAQSVEVMGALEKLAGHPNTKEFVNELTNHLLIARTCANAKKCWSYDKLHLDKDQTFTLDDASAYDGNALFNMNKRDPDGNRADYAEVYAFLMGDGTSFLISYNKHCQTDGKESRNCYVAAFDANGGKAPNSLNEDVFLINTSKFGSDDAIAMENGNGGKDEEDDSICYKKNAGPDWVPPVYCQNNGSVATKNEEKAKEKTEAKAEEKAPAVKCTAENPCVKKAKVEAKVEEKAEQEAPEAVMEAEEKAPEALNYK